MSDLNLCQFIGHLGKDPEIRYSADGKAVANLSLAVTENWKKDGEKQEKTEWVRCVAFGRLAEIIGEYLKKGSQAYVSGKMQTRKWQDKDGQDRYTTEVVVNQLQMLSKAEPQTQQAISNDTSGGGDFEDSIPF